MSVTRGLPVGGRGTTGEGTCGRVLIVAKAPVAGRSKTRLVPPLTGDQAAALQQAMLLDTIDACRREVDDVRLLVADRADSAPLALLCPDLPIEIQTGRGLGEALRAGLARSIAAAFSPSTRPSTTSHFSADNICSHCRARLRSSFFPSQPF